MKMYHKNVATKQLYIWFQADELKQYFPSLIPIIDSMGNVSKNGTMGTKSMGTTQSIGASS